jgi:hypothetical protein
MKRHILCGFECLFPKISAVWDFWDLMHAILGQYHFKVADDAVYSDHIRFDLPKEFSADYFQELVNLSFVSERLVLHAYSKEEDCAEINYYSDFLKSNCEIVILLYDFCYFEIYCKNQHMTKELMQIAEGIADTIVEEKYEDTDDRTELHVG